MTRLIAQLPIAAVLFALLPGFTALEALFAPEAELWPRW